MLTRNDRVPTGAYIRAASVTVVVAVGALWLMRGLLQDGLYLLASTIGAVTLFLLIVYLRRRYSAMRWMALGIVLAAVFGVYPIVYNVYIGFTNMGDGHLFTKQQSVDRLESEQFLPDDADTYEWAGYQSDTGFGILLVDADPPRFVTDSGDEIAVDAGDIADGEGPAEIGEYHVMAPRDVLPRLDALAELNFGDPARPVRVQSLHEAATSQQRYRYDASADAITDLSDGTVYENVDGSWVGPDGDELVPGFIAFIGTENYQRYLGDEALRSPLLRVVAWNFVFAGASVGLAFLVGLGVAVLFDDLPGRRLIRALLIVPYPIPVLVSVLIWRSLLNPDLGMIGQFFESVFGSSPQFFLNANWARVALIVINIWLSYPYFYVVTSGGLRAIPGELYDAAEVDGAGAWRRFRHITVPQLMVIVMPLLIASFSFNFNNFNLIWIFNEGDPPVAGSIVPIGRTDILISFVYKLAFTPSSAADYGLGAAISVALFLVVGAITIFQIRATRTFVEEA